MHLKHMTQFCAGPATTHLHYDSPPYSVKSTIVEYIFGVGGVLSMHIIDRNVYAVPTYKIIAV